MQHGTDAGSNSGLLLTDLYQLTMAHAYFDARMADTAVFEFFVRALPSQRRFLIAGGIEQALDFLQKARFTAAELAWLRELGRFPERFIDHLAELRFSGEVHAMPEGALFFADEPVLRVSAPIAEAQLMETRLINLLHFQSLIASKAARCVLAAPGRMLVDFGLRRAHGAEAGLLAARAAYLAGFDATATVLAGQRFGIPLSGTMAHSYVEAHADETAAFLSFARAERDNVVLLIDTYDTEAGARHVVALAPRLAAEGITVKGVRIDSGDLALHARRVRRILDAGGLREVKILLSGNLDEYRLQEMVAAKVPADGFGVGTHMDTSADRPYLDCAYKLMAYGGRPRRKRSEGKATWPGPKQVFRHFGADGMMCGDTVTAADEPCDGEPLLRPVMAGGRRLDDPEPLEAVRSRVRRSLTQLPTAQRRLDGGGEDYPVTIAPRLRELAASVDREVRPFDGGEGR